MLLSRAVPLLYIVFVWRGYPAIAAPIPFFYLLLLGSASTLVGPPWSRVWCMCVYLVCGVRTVSVSLCCAVCPVSSPVLLPPPLMTPALRAQFVALSLASL